VQARESCGARARARQVDERVRAPRAGTVRRCSIAVNDRSRPREYTQNPTRACRAGPRRESCSGTTDVRLLVALSLVVVQTAAASPDREQQPCADPDEVALTRAELPGFDNAVAAVIGRALEARVEATWRAQRRGFLRDPETMPTGDCEIVLAAPYGNGAAGARYRRSVYVIALQQLYRRIPVVRKARP
jgi:hypothetical protein